MRILRRALPALTLLLAACTAGSGPLLAIAGADRPALSPDLRGRPNLFEVAYELGAPAEVSASIQAADGRQWVVYENQSRPTPGAYRLLLDGTVPGPGPNERRALPDGAYRVRLTARAGAAQEEAAIDLHIRDADTVPPEIDNLTLFPASITPNFDAIDDVTRITYRVSKAYRLTHFADRVLDDGRRRRAWTGDETKVDAGEQRLSWDGTVAGRPLADGDYEFGVRAEDLAGNVSEVRRSLHVEAGGTPEAKIVWARISPRQIVRGQEVCADITVRNIGQTVLRSQGPDPEYVYDSFDTYASIDDHAHVERAGYWRIGLDWATSSSTMGAKYPYRWGFGRDLQPGEEATVHGCVRVSNEQRKMVFFAALIQENVAIHDNGVGLAEIRLSP